jgi:hypothetical protein
MIELVIGLCFGIASAAALVVMWRMAEHLRKEVQSRENPPAETKVPRSAEALRGPVSDS